MWYLRKEWIDREDGIDGVVIHFTSTSRGQRPPFGHPFEQRVMVDYGGYPRVRRKVLKMPRTVWDGGGWAEDYAFHHFFEVWRGGHAERTDLFSEDIVHKELEFVDNDGVITNICVHWAVEDWEAPVFSPMEDPRFPADSEFRSLRYYGYEDKPRFHHAKYHMLREIPLPHRWQGGIWGPRGATVVQQYHIGRLYGDEQYEIYFGPDGPSGQPASYWIHHLE